MPSLQNLALHLSYTRKTRLEVFLLLFFFLFSGHGLWVDNAFTHLNVKNGLLFLTTPHNLSPPLYFLTYQYISPLSLTYHSLVLHPSTAGI